MVFMEVWDWDMLITRREPLPTWDDVLKTLAQALNAFGSGLYPGASPGPKGLKMIIFLPQRVNSGERLIGDYWICLRGFAVVRTECSEAEPHFRPFFLRMLRCEGREREGRERLFPGSAADELPCLTCEKVLLDASR